MNTGSGPKYISYMLQAKIDLRGFIFNVFLSYINSHKFTKALRNSCVLIVIIGQSVFINSSFGT